MGNIIWKLKDKGAWEFGKDLEMKSLHIGIFPLMEMQNVCEMCGGHNHKNKKVSHWESLGLCLYLFKYKQTNKKKPSNNSEFRERILLLKFRSP